MTRRQGLQLATKYGDMTGGPTTLTNHLTFGYTYDCLCRISMLWRALIIIHHHHHHHQLLWRGINEWREVDASDIRDVIIRIEFARYPILFPFPLFPLPFPLSPFFNPSLDACTILYRICTALPSGFSRDEVPLSQPKLVPVEFPRHSTIRQFQGA